MTHVVEQLQVLKEQKKLAIKDLQSQIDALESEIKTINAKIFRIKNNAPVILPHSEIPPINER